jgi:N-acetylglucosaminyldiphosphoundecaprenol N-acetyl-beta-D-mannosaminyltransferase
MDKIPFAGIHIDNLSQQEAMETIRVLLDKKHFGYIVTPNAQHINILQKDKEFKKIYDRASLILADGMSIVFALRILGYPLKEKCSGADMFNDIIGLAAELGRNLFILGGNNGSEFKAVARASQLYPHLHIQSFSPRQGFERDPVESRSIIQRITASNTDVLFICVGSPKSEKWIYRNKDRLGKCLVFPLGDSLNFFAGIKKRAPKWMRDSGLEWLYRFAKEPRRLWKRYLIGNIQFAGIFVRELWKKIGGSSQNNS